MKYDAITDKLTRLWHLGSPERAMRTFCGWPLAEDDRGSRSDDLAVITCKACKRTKHYATAVTEAEHASEAAINAAIAAGEATAPVKAARKPRAPRKASTTPRKPRKSAAERKADQAEKDRAKLEGSAVVAQTETGPTLVSVPSE